MKGIRVLFVFAIWAALCGCTVSAAEIAARKDLAVHSMLTRDGRRMVSYMDGTNTVYELVPTNQLPSGLPPVREWKLYGLKATHTDIGLHNSQYIQRHGTVRRIDEAARLIDADPRPDDDPAAYRYVMEGFWFWDNYHMDKGMDAAWRIVTNYIARGRMDVGVTCAGNHTHLFSRTEIDRSTLTKKLLADKWGISTRTFLMADNPGMSCSLITPYLRAGIRYGIFMPNHWNPHPSTIWRKNKAIPASTWNPDAMGGGARVEVSYDSPLPMVFRWKAPESDDSLLMWCSTQYGHGYERLGIKRESPTSIDEVERKLPALLSILERKYPYDIWLAAQYGDDEWPTTGFADFAAEWNKKWAWPQFHTVGRLDEPFEHLEKNFGDKIPTLTGEMTSGWLQHAASAPELLADKLNADRMLETAERLGTFAGTIDRGAVDRAWWCLILNDEHSYGTSGYQGRRVFETWMQHRDWIERAAAIASNELNKAVAKLGLQTGTTGVSPVANGQDARSPSTCCRNGVTENRWYRVTVTNGVIYSIYDKDLKRELIDAPANRFLYTRDNHKTWEADPVAALGAEVTQRVYLAEDAKRIDIVNTFKHARDLFNTKRYYRFGYMAFPFAVPDGRFAAHLNGMTISPYEDCHPMTSDAYFAVRDWCAVENGDFGVALMMRDSTLTEFGEIHPDKTCYTGKPPIGKSAIYPYLFTDWLQMHQPDGDSMNFTFRFAITSYANGDRGAKISRLCEDWLDPYAKWMRAHDVPRVTRETIAEPPPEWTGLIEKPRAGHGEKDGQMYLLWGAEMSPDFDHYELYRDEKFLANVTNEVPDGIPYRVARYEDLGLPTHSRHEYRLRKVWKDGRKDELGEPFHGLTRYVSDEERNGVAGQSEQGSFYVRYDGATVTSWRPAALEGQEVFFMPANTPWGKEVHGGLPICWPWFGKAEGKPKHGLARYLRWRLVRRVGKSRMELETESTPETLKVWPHPFRLRAVVSIAGTDSLNLVVTETNTGTAPYESAFAVHPYFAVADACKVFLDGTPLPKPWTMKEFASDGKSHRLEDRVWRRTFAVSSSGNDAWCVWNPGIERTPLCETLAPDEWKRFFCLEPLMKKRATLASGKSRTHTVVVKVGAAPALAARNLEPSKVDSRYFADAQGKTFVPVGCNICFPRMYEGSPESRAECEKRFFGWLRKFAANSGNFTRLWLGHAFFEIMPEKAGVYDPAAETTLKKTVALCEELGIKLKLTFESFRTVHPAGKEGKGQYSTFFNRPLYAPYAKNMHDFLHSEKCVQIYLGKARRLRELGLGDSPTVACWELWNEIDCIGPWRGDVGPWSDRMFAELRTMFPRQMTVQNLGSYGSPAMYDYYDYLGRIPLNDFMQMHCYLDAGTPIDVCHGPMDILAANAVRELLDRRGDVPAILAEVGAVKISHTGPSELYPKDRHGMLLHDEIFAPFFAGSAGCGQPWHWDHQYIDANDLWWHFRRFARAVEGIDPAAEHFRPFHTETRRLRIWGLRGDRTTLLWCRDKLNTWESELVCDEAPKTVSGEKLPRVRKFTCYLPWEDRWTDTLKGNVLPDFTRSVVVKIEK